MPKSVKLHTGERLDLPDLVQGTVTFAQDSINFSTENEVIDNRSRVLDGFRVRLEDQGLFPGQITVYNGLAINRDGHLFTNEDTVDDSRSVTLQGVNTTFYVEVELSLSAGDSDARYFWDPTQLNISPIPNGAEFTDNVATRGIQDWRIVRPVSTTGFDQSSNPNSLRVPVAVLRTDGANVIDVGSNPGLLLVNPASTLEADIASAVFSFRVLDGRIFPPTPYTIVIDFGGGTPETRTVTGHDKTNDILTLSAATASSHKAGARVQVTSPLTYFLAENKDPSDPTLNPLLATPGHPDMAQRLYQANELRGSALLTSKDYPGVRDDLGIKSTKDHVDYLAAQIHELKFGSPRVDELSVAPPLTFATRPRWYDPAGSVQGARTNTFSIGNGTTTFGDFNGTTDAAFTAALAALPGTGGTLFIKPGTYTFANTVTVSKPVTFLGSGTTNTSILNANAAGAAFNFSSAATIENLAIAQTGAGLQAAFDVISGVTITLQRCLISTAIRVNGVQGTFKAHNCVFTFSPAASSMFQAVGAGSITYSSFTSCTFTAASSNIFGLPVLYTRISNNRVSATSFMENALVGYADVQICNNLLSVNRMLTVTGTQAALYLTISDNVISVPVLKAGDALFNFTSSASPTAITIDNNTVLVATLSATSSSDPGSICSVVALADTKGFQVTNNNVTFPSGGYAVFAVLDCIGTTSEPIKVVGNSVTGGNSLVRFGSAVSNMSNGHFLVEGNSHNNAGLTDGAIGIDFYVGAGTPVVYSASIHNNTFTNYTGTIGSACIGVRYVMSSAHSLVSIENNTFSYFGNATYASDVAAVLVPTVASGSGSLTVKNNNVYDLQSNGGDVHGIEIAPNFVGNATQYDVSHNTVKQLVQIDVAAVTDTVGVYLAGLYYGTVSNNTVNTVITSTTNGAAVGILLENCGANTATGLVVSSNVVSTCKGATGATVAKSGASIKLTGNVENTIISGNTLSQYNTVVGTSTQVPSALYVYSDSVRHLSILSNTVNTGTVGGATGILVQGISTGALFENVSIQNNTVNMQWVGVWTAISVVAGGSSSGITVSNNIVREYAVGDSHVGISVTGYTTPSLTRSITIQGNTLSGMKSGALAINRTGILVADCVLTNVSNNTVDWSHPAVAEGNGISLLSNYAATCRQHVVSNNIVSPDANVGTSEIFLQTANILDGIANGNSLGNGVNTGLLTPAVAPAHWVYANNKLA